jgi:hypothetical protein
MAAVCWAHAHGESVVVGDGPGIPDPLGSCFVCQVFSCGGHAELDLGTGRWICSHCLAKATAASSGVGAPTRSLHVESHVGFERRFPLLARATHDHRDAAFDSLKARRKLPNVKNQRLLADAVGLAHALRQGGYPEAHLATPKSNLGRTARTDEARNLSNASFSLPTSRPPLFSGEFGQLLIDLES